MKIQSTRSIAPNENAIYLNAAKEFSSGEYGMMATIVHEYVHFAQAHPEQAPIYSNNMSTNIIEKNKIGYMQGAKDLSLYMMQPIELQLFYISNEVKRILGDR